MGLFSKRVKTITCPICSSEIEQSTGAQLGHWESHVWQIPEGQGDASGQYSWDCVCGPAGLKWPKPDHAAAGLAVHMMERHGVRV